jgi:hypothetical protein
MKRSRLFYFTVASIAVIVTLFFTAIIGVYMRSSSGSPATSPTLALSTKNPPPTPSALDMRETLRVSYEEMLSRSMPHLNFIRAKVIKGQNGYELYGVHSYFSRYSFDIGHLAKDVRAWMLPNRSVLEYAGIVRVGVKDADYGGATWFNVK